MNFPADTVSIANDDRIHPAFRRGFVAAEVARCAPRDLQQLMAADADVDSAFMAEICRVGSDRWLEVREQEGADHAAEVRADRLARWE
jgi:hypothetical protein